ncbi:MAG: hypothetical protein JWM87_426 [Candidatus Eremiobacteraeota bacterium]|nr:hypothetical protein [Candidatus Eremiobacteraeota bacterium]
MREAKSVGYRVDLTFIALSNADAHVARVADRVAAGLHGIPEQRIRDRYVRALTRAADALCFVDHAIVLDNSSATAPFRLLLEIEQGEITSREAVLPRWAQLIQALFFDGIRKGDSGE